MIDALAISPDEVFEICSRQFGNIGLHLRPPKSTPLKKSYIWRHVQRLTKVFNKWEFSSEEIDIYMQVAVEYLKNLPRKTQTLQFVLKKDVLEYCYNQMQYRQSTQESLMGYVDRTTEWLQNLSNDVYTHLIESHKPGAMPNIVLYYKQGRLSELYLACSRTCRRALNTVAKQNPAARSHAPSNQQLYFLTTYKSKQLAQQVKSRLGEMNV